MSPTITDRLNRRSALVDLAWVLVTLLILKAGLLQLDQAWTYAGPVSLLAALAVASWRLKKRGINWTDVGMGRPKSLKWLPLWTVLALVATTIVGILAGTAAIELIGSPDAATQALDARYQGRFAGLAGNLQLYLFWLAVAWIVGGFAEEMLFRGAMIAWCERLFAGIPFPVIFAIGFQAVLFGQQHAYYQGLAGWASTGAIAFASGLLYLAFKRRLWPLILSHGLNNTLGLTLIYLGVMN